MNDKPLTVKQLIEELQKVPQDLIVVVPERDWHNFVYGVAFYEDEPFILDPSTGEISDAGLSCVSLWVE